MSSSHSIDKTYNLQGSAKPTTKRSADLDGPDFYPTPGWATFSLLDNERFSGEIAEPACGDGSMAKVIEDFGYSVIASDLYDRGYGTTGIDFLKQATPVDNIITNPPFNAAEGFVAKCHALARSKFALLLRLAFLEGANRQKTIFNFLPPARVWVFSERITFYPANAERKGSGTTAYAWFVWDKEHFGGTELKWIPLGYKSRFDHANKNPTLFR